MGVTGWRGRDAEVPIYVQNCRSNLGIHRVAVHTDKVHQYASLMSLDTFSVIAGISSESTPLSQQSVSLPLSFLFPQAHAYWGESVVNWFLPVQEVKAIIQQLTYAVTDPEKFEGDVLIVNLIIAVTYFPPGRVLQPFAKTLGVVFKTLKAINPKFMKYFAGMFKGVMGRAKKGDFDTLWHMLPFFIIVAEMYEDEEAREGLKFLFETVDSGEDVLSWVDYLALPDGDWEGSETPEVALLNEMEHDLPLSWMMNKAYAQTKLKRVNGKILGASLARVGTVISRQAAPKLPDVLKIMSKEFKTINAAALRKYIFNPSLLSGAVGVAAKRGANAVKAFLTGKTNSRFHPVVVMSMVAYVEWESTCGTLIEEKNKDAADKLECADKGIIGEKNRLEISKLYGRIFADSLSRKFDEETDSDEEAEYNIKPRGHGALYHLSQIAYFQLLHRAGGSPIKEIEASRWVWMYKDKDVADDLRERNDPNQAKASGSFIYRRSVDIAVGKADEAEQWIELKSYRALDDKGNDRKKLAVIAGKEIGQWSGGKSGSVGKSSLHKQFSIDRAAAHDGQARVFNEKTKTYSRVEVSDNFKWRFQKFKVSKPNIPLEIHVDIGAQREKGTVLYGLTQDLAGTGLDKKQLVDANFDPQEINASLHVGYASVGSLISNLSSIGFKELADVVIDAEE